MTRRRQCLVVLGGSLFVLASLSILAHWWTPPPTSTPTATTVATTRPASRAARVGAGTPVVCPCHREYVGPLAGRAEPVLDRAPVRRLLCVGVGFASSSSSSSSAGSSASDSSFECVSRVRDMPEDDSIAPPHSGIPVGCREAFVTLLTSDSYLPGVLALVAALRQLEHRPRDIVVLVTTRVSDDVLDALLALCVVVWRTPPIPNPHRRPPQLSLDDLRLLARARGQADLLEEALANARSNSTPAPPPSLARPNRPAPRTPVSLPRHVVRAVLGTLSPAEAAREAARLRGAAFLRGSSSATSPASDGVTPDHARFEDVYTKMVLWRLVQYDRLVYLDADQLPLRPYSSLFRLLGPADDGSVESNDDNWSVEEDDGGPAELDEAPGATHGADDARQRAGIGAKDARSATSVPVPAMSRVDLVVQPQTLWQSHYFGSGLLVVRPSEWLFRVMEAAFNTTESFDGADMGFLNAFWGPFDPRGDPAQLHTNPTEDEVAAALAVPDARTSASPASSSALSLRVRRVRGDFVMYRRTAELKPDLWVQAWRANRPHGVDFAGPRDEKPWGVAWTEPTGEFRRPNSSSRFVYEAWWRAFRASLGDDSGSAVVAAGEALFVPSPRELAVQLFRLTRSGP